MLRLMTLNINYRVGKHGAWDARRALIADAIRRSQADVVALQAVERVNGSGQAAELAALVDYEYVDFAAAMKTPSVTRGSAFIARRRLGEIAVHRFSHRGDHEDRDHRVVLRSRIDTRGGAIDLYNAHFSWVAPQALENAKETIAFRQPGPSLLLGDLNNSPGSQVIQLLRDAGWTDTWAALRADEPGWTFEADKPSMRIDYVMASPELLPRVRSIECVQAEGNGPPRLSDHLGLLITLGDN